MRLVYSARTSATSSTGDELDHARRRPHRAVTITLTRETSPTGGPGRAGRVDARPARRGRLAAVTTRAPLLRVRTDAVRRSRRRRARRDSATTRPRVKTERFGPTGGLTMNPAPLDGNATAGHARRAVRLRRHRRRSPPAPPAATPTRWPTLRAYMHAPGHRAALRLLRLRPSPLRALARPCMAQPPRHRDARIPAARRSDCWRMRTESVTGAGRAGGCEDLARGARPKVARHDPLGDWVESELELAFAGLHSSCGHHARAIRTGRAKVQLRR